MNKKILIYGDSMLYDIKDLSGYQVHNECVLGLTIYDARQDQEKQIGLSMFLDETNYDAVVICLGTNDLGQLFDIKSICQDFKRFIGSINKSNLKICVLGLPHATEAENQIFKQRLPKMCHYFPFIALKPKLLKDGLHLNQEGITASKNQLISQLDQVFN